MAIEIVDLPIENGEFSIVMLVYQRVIWKLACTTPVHFWERKLLNIMI